MEGLSGKRERQVQRLERRVNLPGLRNSEEARRSGATNRRREKAMTWERRRCLVGSPVQH